MSCNSDTIKLMHNYLDGDISEEEEAELRSHLKESETCQRHFHELQRTITLVQSTEEISIPDDFTSNVMQKLPQEKKQSRYLRWFKLHPIITSAAIFFIFMLSGMLSVWNNDSELVVSKQDNLVIEGDTVIVPAGETVSGDVVVKNGDLRIDGTVDGDVILVNGNLIDEDGTGGTELMASTVNGDLRQVDQLFEWIWFHLKEMVGRIF